MRIRAKVLIATGVSIVLAGGAWALNRPEPQPVAFTPQQPLETTVVEEPAPAPEPETEAESQPRVVEAPEPELRVCYQDEVPRAIQSPWDKAFREYLDEFNLAKIEGRSKPSTNKLDQAENKYEAALIEIGCRRPNDAEFQAWLVRTGRNQ